MLKRFWLLLLLLAAFSPAAADVTTGSLTRSNLPAAIGGNPDCKDARVFCVGKQASAEYSVIGGRDCTSATAPNAAGSALYAALPLATDPNNPVIVRVSRGLYQECLAIDPNAGSSNVAVTDGLVLELEPDVIIRPAVTTAASVEGGVIAVGAVSAATAQNVVKNLRIIAYGATVQNDAFSSPEAALQIERETCTSTSSVLSWLVEGGRWIGAHDSIQWCLDNTSSNSATQIPRGIVRNLTSIGGADNLVHKGNAWVTIQNVIAHTMTNYCETTDTTITDARSGTVASGTSTTVFTIDASESAVNHAFAGRKVTLSGGTCAAGYTGWIKDSNTSRALTVFPAAGFTPDNTCSYAIAAVPNATEAPCRDIDWTVIRAQAAIEFGYWKTTCIHRGSQAPTTQAADLDRLEVQGLTCTIDVNDFGAEVDSSTCTNTGTTQQFIACWLDYAQRRYQNASATDLDCTINLNVDLPDLNCTNPVGCVVAAEAAIAEGTLSVNGMRCTVNNAGDDDENMAAIVERAGNVHTMRVDGASLDINNTVGSYVGTSTTIIQTGTGTIQVGNITSPDTISVTADAADISLLPGASMANSGTLDFGSITSDCVEVVNGGGAATITVLGAAAGDSCSVGVPTAAAVLKSSWTCRVTAANTVTVKHCCNNGTCDPASGTYTATVRRQ